MIRRLCFECSTSPEGHLLAHPSAPDKSSALAEAECIGAERRGPANDYASQNTSSTRPVDITCVPDFAELPDSGDRGLSELMTAGHWPLNGDAVFVADNACRAQLFKATERAVDESASVQNLARTGGGYS
jgi:hypothetical protein